MGEEDGGLPRRPGDLVGVTVAPLMADGDRRGEAEGTKGEDTGED